MKIKITGSPPNTLVEIDGKPIPIGSVDLHVDVESVPRLVLTPAIYDIDVYLEGDVDLDEDTKRTLLALGWTPPAADGTKPAMSDEEFGRRLRKWIRINPDEWERELHKIMRRSAQPSLRG